MKSRRAAARSRWRRWTRSPRLSNRSEYDCVGFGRSRRLDDQMVLPDRDPQRQRMNLDFSGKTAIVTGAAHGFGRAISVAFATRGASVWACDLIETELHETRHQCTAKGGACTV